MSNFSLGFGLGGGIAWMTVLLIALSSGPMPTWNATIGLLASGLILLGGSLLKNGERER